MKKRAPGAVAALVLSLTAHPALAHHSFAMFDHSRSVTLKGEVTKFQWTNPHAILELDVPEANGVQHFSLEMTSINMMQRVGWRSTFIKAGDKVRAVMAPLVNGEHGGLLLEITLADGRTLQLPVPAPGTFKRTPGSE